MSLPQNSAPQNISPQGLALSIERHLRLYFAAHEGRLPASGLYDRVLREVEKPLILQALQACRGNQLKAAQLLGLNRNTLRKKMAELGIAAKPNKAAESARHAA